MSGPFWDPRDERDNPDLSFGELIRAAPAGCLFAIVLAAIALAFLLVGVPTDPLPGWFQ